jgi:hypothetical protein
MKYNTDKIDEVTLALLYLVTWREKYAIRAWKSFQWETMDRLYEKGYISDPQSKAKSVVMTDEGYREAEESFRKLFAEES